MKSANEQFSKLLRVSVTAVATAILQLPAHILVQEMKERQAKGEKDLTIFNGKIVKKLPYRRIIQLLLHQCQQFSAENRRAERSSIS